MSLVKNFKMMSAYNQSVNEQLITCCAALTIKQLNQDSKSFFPSIIAYWNHILFGDLILLSRLAQNNVGNLSREHLSTFPQPKSPRDIYCNDFSEVIILRRKVDSLIQWYCDNLTEEECEQFISYRTTEGQSLTKAVADITQHLFNHQTHHRGQLTCVLSQLGVDYGCMDLPVIIAEGSNR